MSDTLVAKRYAEAFIEVAAEADKVDAFSKDIQTFLGALQANDGQLFGAVASPVFTAEERGSVLAAVLPMLGLDPLVANLIKVMNDNRRLAAFPAVAEAYRDLADARAGRMRVRVETAEPLTPELEVEVRTSLEKVTGKTIIVETTVDPSLIGGMIAHVGGKVYDSSLRTRLQELKQRLASDQAVGQA